MRKIFFILFCAFVFNGCASLKSVEKKQPVESDVLGTVSVSTLGFTWQKFERGNRKTEKLIQRLEEKALKKYGQNIRLINADVGRTHPAITPAMWAGAGVVGLGSALIASTQFSDGNGTPTNQNGYNTCLGVTLGTGLIFFFKGFQAKALVVKSDSPYVRGSLEVFTEEEIKQIEADRIAAEKKAHEEKLAAEKKALMEQREAERKAKLEKEEADLKARQQKIKAEMEQREAERKAEIERLEAEKALWESKLKVEKEKLKSLIQEANKNALLIKQELINRAKKHKSPIAVTNAAIYDINSADGVSIYIDYINTSDKVIKYIDFELIPYNRVYDPLPAKTKIAQVVNFIKSNSVINHSAWDCIWYDSSLLYFEIKSIKVIYQDNSSDKITDKKILNDIIFTFQEQEDYNNYTDLVSKYQDRLKDY